MSELSPDKSSIAGVDAGSRKAVAHEARGAQTWAVTSAPVATPIADIVEAMLKTAIACNVCGSKVRCRRQSQFYCSAREVNATGLCFWADCCTRRGGQP
jgi:hypothetical protein